MTVIRSLLSLIASLFRRKTEWDDLPYSPPATVEDELARLNNER